MDTTLTTESYDVLENNLFCNQNYLQHFFHVPRTNTNIPMPKNKNDRYLFPFYSDNGDYHTDIDNMSRETDNEYIIMKYNYKGFDKLSDKESDEESDEETAIDKYVHLWNVYRWDKNIRLPIHKCCGINGFYARPYAKLSGKSKGFLVQGYEVNWNKKISKQFNCLLCHCDKETLPYHNQDDHHKKCIKEGMYYGMENSQRNPLRKRKAAMILLLP